MSNSLDSHGLEHTRLPCPLLSPRVCSDSCPLSSWCHSAIWSSVAPFSSRPQSFPASGSFPMSRLFVSGGQSIGTSALASVLPANIHGWFLLELTGLLSRGYSRVFNSTTIPKHQFFGVQSSLLSNSQHYLLPWLGQWAQRCWEWHLGLSGSQHGLLHDNRGFWNGCNRSWKLFLKCGDNHTLTQEPSWSTQHQPIFLWLSLCSFCMAAPRDSVPSEAPVSIFLYFDDWNHPVKSELGFKPDVSVFAASMGSHFPEASGEMASLKAHQRGVGAFQLVWPGWGGGGMEEPARCHSGWLWHLLTSLTSFDISGQMKPDSFSAWFHLELENRRVQAAWGSEGQAATLLFWGPGAGVCVKVKVKSLSHVRLFATPWTVAYHTPGIFHGIFLDFPGKSTGVSCHFLLQGIFLTQGSNPGLPHCRQMLYHLSHQGSPGNTKALAWMFWLRKEFNCGAKGLILLEGSRPRETQGKSRKIRQMSTDTL